MAPSVTTSFSGPIVGVTRTLAAGMNAKTGIISATVQCGANRNPSTHAAKKAMTSTSPNPICAPIFTER